MSHKGIALTIAAASLAFAVSVRAQVPADCTATAKRLVAFERFDQRRVERGRWLRQYAVRLRRGIDRFAGRFADDCVHLNEIQVLGTHNSYHVQPQEPLWSELLSLSSIFEAWGYTHLPLDEQFETQGVRQIEIDVFADPEGALYAQRGALAVIGLDPDSHLPALDEPGMKVLHIQDVDFETRCLTFIDCLETVKAWSDGHPRHLPIMIQIEVKEDTIPSFFGIDFAVPVPFGTAEFNDLDDEIRSVFPDEQLITPDDVRQGLPTLEEAVTGVGWPTLGEARGKVLFTLDNGGDKRIAYLEGHPLLQGRVLFTNANPGDPDAAFVKRNDPLADTEIPDLVAAGYLVRTRADADTVQARSGDTTMRDAALASGAQFVSTDYPVENPDFGTGYAVSIPGGHIARCNPINGPAACRSAALEAREP